MDKKGILPFFARRRASILRALLEAAAEVSSELRNPETQGPIPDPAFACQDLLAPQLFQNSRPRKTLRAEMNIELPTLNIEVKRRRLDVDWPAGEGVHDVGTSLPLARRVVRDVAWHSPPR
jgi:hypothetical protein